MMIVYSVLSIALASFKGKKSGEIFMVLPFSIGLGFTFLPSFVETLDKVKNIV